MARGKAAKEVPHTLFITAAGRASHCAKLKAAEKAITDIAKGGLAYTHKPVTITSCPICTPPKATSQEDAQEAAQEPAEYVEEARPGQCGNCRGTSFLLTYKVVPGRMVRICRGCGTGLDLITMEPLEGKFDGK